MSFTNRIRFEAVVNAQGGYVKPDMDAMLKDFVKRMSEEFPGAYISASANISHEMFEQNVDVKAFVGMEEQDVIFGTAQQQAIESNSNGRSPINAQCVDAGPIEGITIPSPFEFGQSVAANTPVVEPKTEAIQVAPQSVPEAPKEVIPSQSTNGFSLPDVIDALSRVKEISAWMDQARVVMEDVPKIRNELGDITENLLKVFQNGQPKNGQ